MAVPPCAAAARPNQPRTPASWAVTLSSSTVASYTCGVPAAQTTDRDLQTFWPPPTSTCAEESDAGCSKGREVEPELPVLDRGALRLTEASADAEDLVQETSIRAFRALDTFDGED